MRWARATKAIVTGLVVAAATVVPLSVTGPAQAGYRVSDLVGIRMLDVNVLRSDCRTYPVEWVVGNLDTYWGAEYTVDWRLQLTLANPSQPDERGARILLKGTGPKSGRSEFRLCGTKHSAGRFVASATLASFPRTSGDCSPSTLSGDVSRACSFPFDAGRDRAQITTLFKRPVKLSARPGCPVSSLTDFRDRSPIVGRLLLQGDDGRWKAVAGRYVILQGDDAFELGKEWQRLNRTTTSGNGYFRMGAPQYIEGGSYRVVVPPSGRHLGAIVNISDDPIACSSPITSTPSTR